MKTRALFRLLRERGHQGDVNRLIEALKDSKNLQVADMLQQELAAERGELHIDAVIDKESAMLVHREHGHQKRLSEDERKKLWQLLCLRTQCTRDTWEQRLMDTEERLEQQQKRADQLDETIRLLSAQIEHFLLENKVLRRAGIEQAGAAVTRDAIGGGEKSEPITLLESKIYHLLKAASRALLGEDKIAKEMDRSFKVLEANPKEANIEEAIMVTMKHFRQTKEQKSDSRYSVDETETLLKKLKEMQKEAEQVKLEKKKLMAALANESNIANKRLYALEKRVPQMKDRAKEARLTQTNWKKRCEDLMKGPMLRRIYERDIAPQQHSQQSTDGEEMDGNFEFPPMEYGKVMSPEELEEMQC